MSSYYSQDDVRYRGAGSSQGYGGDSVFLLPDHNDNLPTKSRRDGQWKKRLRLLGLFLIIPVCFLLYILLWPSGIQTKTLIIDTPPKFLQGNGLQPNEYLAAGHRILENQVVGPESMIEIDGAIYATTYTGEVIKIVGDNIVSRIQLGPSCAPKCSPSTEEKTGRPLGIRQAPDGWLIIADAYHGLLALDLATNHSITLLSAETEVKGKKFRFLNDLVVHPDGTIYFTESSVQWQRKQFPYIILEGRGDGRLLSFDPKTGVITQILDRLFFPNGIELADNGTSLLIAETGKARILKYVMPGIDQRRSGVRFWARSLPGFPDNIRRGKHGNYWVCFAATRLPDSFNFIDFTASRPWIRNLIAKIVPSSSLLNLFARFKPSYGIILEMREDGRIVSSWHDTSGKVVNDCSEVLDTEEALYLGSYHTPYLVKVPYTTS